MPKDHYLEVDGQRVRFRRFGGGAKKFIILHGWATETCPTDSHARLAPKLAEKLSCEVILPDMPGFGKSDPPPETGWDTYDYANWLGKFLGKLEIKPAFLYGHSFGCRVIVRFLSKQMKADATDTEKVILTGAAGIKWPPSLRQKVSLYLSKKIPQAKIFLPRKIQKLVLQKILGARDWGAVPTKLKNTLKKVLKERDFRNDLTKIRKKTLLIWGARDSITPLRSGEVFAKSLPNAELKIIREGRHGIHRTHPGQIIKFVAEFLGKSR